jgi:signal transduction histidine kinase
MAYVKIGHVLIPAAEHSARERLRQLGGQLEIQSDTDGTGITARLPLTGRPSTTAAKV